MSLTNDERTTLVTLELKKAHETFEEITILTTANKWSGAANRLYYAVFHAINALLIANVASMAPEMKRLILWMNGTHEILRLRSLLRMEASTPKPDFHTPTLFPRRSLIVRSLSVRDTATRPVCWNT